MCSEKKTIIFIVSLNATAKDAWRTSKQMQIEIFI